MELLQAFLPFIVLMGIMYFLMIRPQKKQQETKLNMLNNLKPGDRIITIGGLHGVVDEVNHTKGIAVIDCEGVYLTFNLPAIAQVVEPVEPVVDGIVVEEVDVVEDVEGVEDTQE